MTDVVRRMLDDWSAARAELAAIERSEHPDITDEHGRLWTWKFGDVYSHDSTLAYPAEWIAGLGLPPESLAQNWNYHQLCGTCTAGWSPEAKARHAQNAIDMADY